MLESSLEILPKDLYRLVRSYSEISIWEACQKLFVRLQTHHCFVKEFKGAFASLFGLEMKQTALWMCLQSSTGERLWEQKIGTKKSASQLKGSILFGDLFGTVNVKKKLLRYGRSYCIIFASGVLNMKEAAKPFRIHEAIWNCIYLEFT